MADWRGARAREMWTTRRTKKRADEEKLRKRYLSSWSWWGDSSSKKKVPITRRRFYDLSRVLRDSTDSVPIRARERDEMRFGRSWISHCLGKVHSEWTSFICAMRRIGKREKTRILECSTAAAKKTYQITRNHLFLPITLSIIFSEEPWKFVCFSYPSWRLSHHCHHENYTEMNLRRESDGITNLRHSSICQKSFINCAIFHWLLSFILSHCARRTVSKSSHTRGVETSPSWLLLCEWALRCVSR